MAFHSKTPRQTPSQTCVFPILLEIFLDYLILLGKKNIYNLRFELKFLTLD